jgi:hypothetical protein
MTVRRTRAKKQKTRKVEARKAPLNRTKRTRAVAEARGLAHRDVLIVSKPSGPNAAVKNIFDQQFGLWSTILRMSPVPFVLRQQATVANLFMAFMLPVNRPPDAGKEK